MMSGLLIADSIPLDIKNLTVCQKIDIGTDGKQNAMPMLRECIKPGAEIVFPIKINKDKFCYTVEDIKRVSNILAKVFENRGHAGDYKKGASPRMLKCTEYCGKMMQLGACLISFEPK